MDLYSRLLVNHLCCEVSVRILWTSIQNYNTLIACLPNESKEILCKNEIIISNSISKPLLFNYVAFIKLLSIHGIVENIVSQSLDNNKKIVMTQEIFQMIMNQTSLKKLYAWPCVNFISKIPPFTTYPGSIDCLRNLSELICNQNMNSEFFHQLSQICHNIQSLDISFKRVNSKRVSRFDSCSTKFEGLEYIQLLS